MAGFSAADYSELLASVVQQHERKLVDQLVKSHPVLDLIADLSTPLSGPTLVMPIEVVEAAAPAFTDGSGTHTVVADPELIKVAKYDVGKPLISTVIVPWDQLKLSSGKNQIFDLAKVHIQAAMKSQRKTISQYLWSAPAARVAGSFESIPSLVRKGGVVGGIDGALNAYWNSLDFTVDTADDADISRVFRRVTNRIERDATDGPDVILCGLSVFEEFEDNILSKGRYDLNSGSLDKAETRFRQYLHGDVLVRYDRDMPANEAYFLRKDALTWRPVAGAFMELQEKRPANTSGVAGKDTLNWSQPFATLAVLGTNERRAHGRLVRTATGVKANPTF